MGFIQTAFFFPWLHGSDGGGFIELLFWYRRWEQEEEEGCLVRK